MQTGGVCFAELPAFTLVLISKQTGLHQSRRNNLKKGVRLFRYFYWFPSKSVLKLADTKHFSSLIHSSRLGVPGEKYFEFCENLTPFLHLCLINKLAKFYQNPTNLHTLLIHLNRDNSCKNKSRVFYLKIFSQFLQLKIIIVRFYTYQAFYWYITCHGFVHIRAS